MRTALYRNPVQELYHKCNKLSIRVGRQFGGSPIESSCGNPISYASELYINNKLLTSLIIPDGVTNINSWAFYGCSTLTSVTIPDSVTSIGYCAFWGCTSLTDITVPHSVSHVGEGAFSNCPSLEKINVSVNNANYQSIAGVLYSKDKATLISYPAGAKNPSYTITTGVNHIGDRAFDNCRYLSNIGIPNSVTSIGNMSFSGCSSLTVLCIPDSVTNIGARAFFGCKNIVGLSFPDNVTYLGFRATEGFPITINPNTVTEETILRWGKFGELVRFTFPNHPDLELRGDDQGKLVAFYYKGNATEVVVPDRVVNVNTVFRNKSHLTKITLPDSLTTIPSNAFSGCSSLTAITLPDNVEYIGTDCFNAATTVYVQPFSITAATLEAAGYSFEIPLASLRTVRLPASLAVIEAKAFEGIAVQRVIIPSGCTTISARAFADCANLVRVEIPASVTNIAWDAFSGCTNLTVVTPEGSIAHSFATTFGFSWKPE